jgi:hypothetical protein
MTCLICSRHLSEVNKADEGNVLKFLEVLAASFPKFFTSSFDSLTELLASDSDEMVDNALRMLTNIGKVISDVEEDNLSQMVRYACQSEIVDYLKELATCVVLSCF